MNTRAIATIGAATFKGFARDKLFYGVLVLSGLFISFSYLISTLTFVEKRKILLDFGFSATSLSGIMVAIFIGVSAVAREIDNRTIYSVLTKPISRQEYLAGKFLGCLLVLAAVHCAISAVLSGILLVTGNEFPAGLLPCYFLMLLESVIILAVSIAFSVNSDSFLSGTFSLAFFLIGRSNPSLHALAGSPAAAPMKALFRFLYWATPNLERFNLRDVVAYGKPYPGPMVAWGVAYCLLYSSLAMLACSWRFQERDLP